LLKSWSRALVAAACCLVAVAAVASARAEDSVINIMNKDWAEKNGKGTAAQPQAPSQAKSQAPSQSAARAPAPARSSVRAMGPRVAAAKAATPPKEPPLPLPDPSLLAKQPEPDCAFKGPVSTPVTAEENRMKLDYEAQCYRQTEGIVRARLTKLQEAVGKLVKAAGARSDAMASSK
jgi:hypothetical protein